MPRLREKNLIFTALRTNGTFGLNTIKKEIKKERFFMDENNCNQHDVLHQLAGTDSEDIFNPSTFQIYKAIDYNTNVFASEVDGKTKNHCSLEFGNRLFLIEEFVQWAINGKPIPSSAKPKPGLADLIYARYYGYMNHFLSTYSPSKIYSPGVELFFETCLVKHGLMPGDFDEDAKLYNPQFQMKNGDFFDQLLEEIASAASQRTFKRKLYARAEAINRGHTSAKKYFDAQFRRYSRLLILRVDFGFRTHDPYLSHPVDLAEAQAHFSRFLNNRRSRALYKHLTGYIWRLEYGRQKGYHWHLFFIFDGSKVWKDGYIASEIGANWIQVTGGKGIFYNCNVNKQKYRRLGIGMIKHDDEGKRRVLLEVLTYMYKEEQILREKHSEKTHGWGRGKMPKLHRSSVGRPRRRTLR